MPTKSIPHPPPPPPTAPPRHPPPSTAIHRHPSPPAATHRHACPRSHRTTSPRRRAKTTWQSRRRSLSAGAKPPRPSPSRSSTTTLGRKTRYVGRHQLLLPRHSFSLHHINLRNLCLHRALYCRRVPPSLSRVLPHHNAPPLTPRVPLRFLRVPTRTSALSSRTSRKGPGSTSRAQRASSRS